MLYFHLGSGLANRLRVMASAYKLASEINTQIRIYWDLRPELNCRFEKLLTLNTDKIKIKNTDVNGVFLGKHYKIVLKQIYYQHFWTKLTDDEAAVSDVIAKIRQNPHKNYYLDTCFNFYHAHDYDFIRPTDNILNKVDTLLSGVDKNHLIGIQIRRTDSSPAIKRSPTELFVDKMHEEIQINPNVMFYLATDDMTVRNYIQKLFPNHILCNPTDAVSRDNEQGMLDGMTDFVSLSRCRKIYGSYFSSFCQVAADFGKKQLIILQNGI